MPVWTAGKTREAATIVANYDLQLSRRTLERNLHVLRMRVSCNIRKCFLNDANQIDLLITVESGKLRCHFQVDANALRFGELVHKPAKRRFDSEVIEDTRMQPPRQSS